jgi:hypothetical protein
MQSAELLEQVRLSQLGWNQMSSWLCDSHSPRQRGDLGIQHARTVFICQRMECRLHRSHSHLLRNTRCNKHGSKMTTNAHSFCWTAAPLPSMVDTAHAFILEYILWLHGSTVVSLDRAFFSVFCSNYFIFIFMRMDRSIDRSTAKWPK